MTDTKTPLLGMDYLMPEQAQKHVTINDALRRLDGLVQLSVIDRSRTAPPSDPQNGDRYLIAANATGAWQRHDAKLALYEDTGWAFIAPQAGWSLWDAADEVLLVFDGTDWKPLAADTTPATPTTIEIVSTSFFETQEAVFDLASEDGVLQIPSHITLLGVTARVLDKITGPSNWKLGTDVADARFGHGLLTAKGAEIIGPADPPAVYWTGETIALTPGHGRFTGGRVAVAIHFIRLPLPTLLS